MCVDIDSKTGIVTLNDNFKEISGNVHYLEYTIVATDTANEGLQAEATLALKIFHVEKTMKHGSYLNPNEHKSFYGEPGRNNGCCLVPCRETP